MASAQSNQDNQFRQFDNLLKILAPQLNGTYSSFRGIEEEEFLAAESMLSKNFNKVANPILGIFGVAKTREQIRKNYEKHYESGIIDFVSGAHKVRLQGRNVGFGLRSSRPFQIQIRCAIKSTRPFLLSVGRLEGGNAKAEGKTVFFGTPAYLKPLIPQGVARRQDGVPDYGHRIALTDSVLAKEFELVANPEPFGRDLAASTAFGATLARNDCLDVVTAGFGDTFGSGNKMVEALAAVDCDGPQVLAQVKVVSALLEFLEQQQVIQP
jgi:hypothetical protein